MAVHDSTQPPAPRARNSAVKAPRPCAAARGCGIMRAVMLTVSSLGKRFGEVPVFHAVSFTLQPGETLVF